MSGPVTDQFLASGATLASLLGDDKWEAAESVVTKLRLSFDDLSAEQAWVTKDIAEMSKLWTAALQLFEARQKNTFLNNHVYLISML